MTHASPRLQRIKAALDEIGAAGDSARLQVHLLSMRARERTGNLAEGIGTLERRIDQNIEQAVEVAASKTRQLSSAVRELLGQASDVSDARLSVKTIMTENVCGCLPDDPLNVAARLMWEHDFGAVPVLSPEGQLCGIVTDRDICMAAYTKGLPLTAILIRDVMSRHVHACSPEDTLERAATLMADAQVRRLPVTDAEGRLVGVVALADIARSAPVLGQREAAELVLQLTRAISQRPHHAVSEQRAAE